VSSVDRATWHSQEKVDEYLARVGGLPARIAGETALVETLPAAPASLLDLGCGDGRLAGFAIHHLEHARKQSLFGEVAAMLRPGGVFANLEVIECASDELQRRFYELIRRPDGDPEDRLAAIEPQLTWMRAAGLRNVDCIWRWRGFALLAGEGPVD
jgi:tRNA (cmo5U34)-methyltransferase